MRWRWLWRRPAFFGVGGSHTGRRTGLLIEIKFPLPEAKGKFAFGTPFWENRWRWQHQQEVINQNPITKNMIFQGLKTASSLPVGKAAPSEHCLVAKVLISE